MTWTDDMPAWEEADERLYEQARATFRTPAYNELVDRLMYLQGFDRDEAEAKAAQIMEDDAA